VSYRRAIPSLVVGVAGVVVFTIGLLQLMKIGTCASGGPFVSARQCPSGTGGYVAMMVGGMLASVVGMIGGGFSGAGLLIWALLFAGSGTAMLVNALTANGLSSGAKSAGYIVGGVFIPIGGIPLIWLIASGVNGLRQNRLRARSVESEATVSRVQQLGQLGYNRAKVRVTYAIQPSNKATFEVSATSTVLASQMPHAGQRVKVRYDPSDHERFELVTPSLADSIAAVSGITQGGRTPATAIASLNAVTRVASPDPLHRLKELTELRDAGTITPAEFDTQKAKILADL
jgi:Short C-terminal domain